MNIVFLAPFGLRPKGTVLARMVPLAAALQALGHKVVIVAPPYTNPEDAGTVEVVQGVTVRNVRLGPGGRALSAPFVAWRLFRAALAERPELVHLFKPKGYGGLAALLLVLLRRLGRRLPPLFVDTDDWEGRGGIETLQPYGMLERRLYRFQEACLPKVAHGVTVASRALEQLVGELGVPARQILYLPNGVAEALPAGGGKAREELGLSPATPVVLLYTRFFEFSQARLHAIFAGICRRVPEVRLLVVGRGRHDEEAQLLAAAREQGFAEALLLAGWVEPTRLPEYLAAADIALYPMDDTLYNRAKCPAKLTELMLLERAVVADAVGQCAEYLVDGESGILCDPAFPAQMIDAAVALLADGGRAAELGGNARRRVLEHFNWRDQAAQLERFYRELCC